MVNPVIIQTRNIYSEYQHTRKTEFNQASGDFEGIPRSLKYLLNGSNMDVPYSYILNSKDICKKAKLFLLIHVPSGTGRLLQRQAVRTTWGQAAKLASLNVAIVFVVGVSQNADDMQTVREESELYGDILQGNFTDEYGTLSLKELFTLEWISDECMNVEYILKADDDAVVNIERLVRKLRTKNYKDSNTFICHVHRKNVPIRDPQSKWYVSEGEYDGDVYPVHCSGLAYIFRPNMMGKLLLAARDTPFIRMADIYLTGRVAALAGLGHTELNHAYAFGQSLERFKMDATNSLIFFQCADMKTFMSVWISVTIQAREN